MGLFAKEKEAPKNYNVIVTTTNEIVGHEIKEYLGIISGRAFINEVIVTTDTDGAKDETRKSLQTAERNLKAEAEAIGANAVIGTTVQYTKARAAILIVLTGTAVIIE